MRLAAVVVRALVRFLLNHIPIVEVDIVPDIHEGEAVGAVGDCPFVNRGKACHGPTLVAGGVDPFGVEFDWSSLSLKS